MLTHVVKQFVIIFINRYIEFMHVLWSGVYTSCVFCNQFTLQMNPQNVHEANKLRDATTWYEYAIKIWSNALLEMKSSPLTPHMLLVPGRTAYTPLLLYLVNYIFIQSQEIICNATILIRCALLQRRIDFIGTIRYLDLHDNKIRWSQNFRKLINSSSVQSLSTGTNHIKSIILVYQTFEWYLDSPLGVMCRFWICHSQFSSAIVIIIVRRCHLISVDYPLTEPFHSMVAIFSSFTKSIRKWLKQCNTFKCLN